MSTQHEAMEALAELVRLADGLEKAHDPTWDDAWNAARAALAAQPVADLRCAKWLDPECADTGACQSLRFKSAAQPAVPDGWKLLKDTTQDDRSWHEDASHENGCYCNTCHHCGRMFTGHKRRVTCKACVAAPPAPNAQVGLDSWRYEASEPTTCKDHLPVAPTPSVSAEPVAWRDHVEQRIRSWRQRTMNKSGDRLAIDDFMGQESIDDLVDFVCDEFASPQPPVSGQPNARLVEALRDAIELDPAASCQDGVMRRCRCLRCVVTRGREVLASVEAAQPTQERKPLTEQEIWDAVQHGVIGGIGFPTKALAVARAIEAAHGITAQPKEPTA